jgi:alpha-L-fucosidase
MDRKGWKIHDCSYAAPDSGKAARAIDGNVKTLWHTHGPDGERGVPQYIAIDMSKDVQIEAFLCMPRRDGTSRALVDQYEYHVSTDGKNWIKVAEGEFGNIANNPVLQTVKLEKPVKARYFKFTATHSANGMPVSAAELGVQEK